MPITARSLENQQRAAEYIFETIPGTNEWYRGCEMGMTFCRLTEQLSSLPGSKIEKELRCLERALARNFPDFSPHENVNLIDLGTGDGQKTILVIRALNGAGNPTVRYVPVDANPYISQYAILSVLASGKKSWNKKEVAQLFGPSAILDFIETLNTDSFSIESLVRLAQLYPMMKDDLFIRDKLIVPMTGLEFDFIQDLRGVVGAAQMLNGNAMNIFCLLGNTLGNYLPEKQKIFLSTLYDEMKAGDLFLLGLSLRPIGEEHRLADKVRHLKMEHQPGEVFMRLGADHPQSKYCMNYDPDAFFMNYSFERPDKTFQDVGFSYLFDAREIINDLDASCFDVVSCETYPGAGDGKERPQAETEPKYLTILIQKTRQ